MKAVAILIVVFVILFAIGATIWALTARTAANAIDRHGVVKVGEGFEFPS